MQNISEIISENQGPPVNIEAIIRSLGIELDKKADLDAEISGQIELTENGSYKISTNKSDNYFRKRFTMAHELGHYLLHAHLIGNGVDDNRAYRSVAAGQFHNRSIGPAQETEANRFAATLLMPSGLVRQAFNECKDDLSKLATTFQVSKQAMEIRLSSLGLKVLDPVS